MNIKKNEAMIFLLFLFGTFFSSSVAFGQIGGGIIVRPPIDIICIVGSERTRDCGYNNNG